EQHGNAAFLLMDDAKGSKGGDPPWATQHGDSRCSASRFQERPLFVAGLIATAARDQLLHRSGTGRFADHRRKYEEGGPCGRAGMTTPRNNLTRHARARPN